MAEFALPALAPARTTGSIADVLLEVVRDDPGCALFSRKVGDDWAEVTAQEFLTEASDVAKGLLARGVRPGDRVGLMARTRYEWPLCDFALWLAGAVPVPIYETSSAEQLQWILSDSEAVACILEGPQHEELLAEVRDLVPTVAHTWTIDAGGLDTLVAAASGVDDEELERARGAVGVDSIATIIYTSGTTGRPKGCELTHGNLFHEVDNAVAVLDDVFRDPDSSTLLFVPLAHVLARVVSVACVKGRARVGHTSDVKNLLADLGVYRPTFLLAVPRVFEKVYNSSEQKAIAAGKGRIFAAAAETAVAWSRSQDEGGPGLGLRLRHTVFDHLVYGKLRTALGGRVRYAISGGAPLGPRLGHFFRGTGLTVLEGYGLTETTAATTINSPGHVKIGTVGRPLPGTAVRIADDGEILLSGPHVFRGYHKNPDATAEAMTSDGWFRSGDIGELDEEGYLRITGRKKELIVTAGGKNVAPAVLEDRLRAHPLVSQCMVVGDRRPYVTALITLDQEAIGPWLRHKGLEERPVAELVEDPVVLAEVQSAVDAANKAVSQAESIKRFSLLPVDFTEEGGQLTPSLKLKRGVVLKEFGTEIEGLYR